jgi:hypothetical protein
MCVRRISWLSGPHSVLDSADKPGWKLVRIPLPTRHAHIEEFVVDAFAIWIKSASFVFLKNLKFAIRTPILKTVRKSERLGPYYQ